ncbi:MAG: beta-hydroxyacyl-ACP dehydratase [Fibrobacteria bacterium]|nr:beta-hydroxyacyl-ACP dehydratase [Fibrobacteria bacterium]
MRFHLIDRIEEIRYGKHIVGVKCVSLSDEVFDEHFPGYPVFPGSLVLEGMAQLAGSFFEIMMDHDGLELRQSVLVMANRMKWSKPAEPGDRILYRADILSRREDFGVAKVQASIDGEVSATGELTFSFVLVDDEELRRSRAGLYRFCMKKTRVIDADEPG